MKRKEFVAFEPDDSGVSVFGWIVYSLRSDYITRSVCDVTFATVL